VDLELSVEEVKQRLDDEQDFVLLDCREHDEVRLATIAGSRHVPLGELSVRLHELDPDDDIVIYCHRGRRSLNLAMTLQAHGFSKVKSMRGGIHAWSDRVDNAVPKY
jgi:rhodanese-related sulfurtransferase